MSAEREPRRKPASELGGHRRGEWPTWAPRRVAVPSTQRDKLPGDQTWTPAGGSSYGSRSRAGPVVSCSSTHSRSWTLWQPSLVSGPFYTCSQPRGTKTALLLVKEEEEGRGGAGGQEAEESGASLSRRSSGSRGWTRTSCVSCTASRCFPTEPAGKPKGKWTTLGPTVALRFCQGAPGWGCR